MSTSDLLIRLEKLKPTGAKRWQARCPAHDDNGPSLSIRELDDGRILVHCFAGCSVYEVLNAVRLELSSLFPPQHQDPEYVGKPERRPFPAADILRAILFEAKIIAVAGRDLLNGKPFTEAEQERLLLSVSRIDAALDVGGISHE